MSTLLFFSAISYGSYGAPLIPSIQSKDAELSSVSAEHDWTGFYAGGNIGAFKNTMRVTDNQATTFYATVEEITNPQLTGGFQLGYRRQIEQSAIAGLYGLEFSANFSDGNFNQEYGSPYALYELNATNTLKNVYLLELLGGITIHQVLLFFGAGFSWTHISNTMTTLDGVPYFESFSFNKVPFGIALSGGIEYALTKALSARFKLDVITPNAYVVSSDSDNTFQISSSITQGLFGLNYTFF